MLLTEYTNKPFFKYSNSAGQQLPV